MGDYVHLYENEQGGLGVLFYTHVFMLHISSRISANTQADNVLANSMDESMV